MPFPLNDAVIRDFDHVRVERIAARDGQPCRYKKVFKPAIGANGAELYWMQRENDFLLEFQLHKLPHTVRLASFNQTGGGGRTAVLTAIETLDAGVTLLDWLNLSVRYDGGQVCQHPFQPLGQFLRLLQACLWALNGIHALGIVHCDLKPDNLCLPHTPYPCQAGPLAIDFDKLALIDFAFALSPQRLLLRPLPVLPTQGYQAGLLKTALCSGQTAQQQLDWRLDLYSLGYLADDILRQSLIVPPGNQARATMAGAERLVTTLLGFDRERRFLETTQRPHAKLLAEIDSLLAGLGASAYAAYFTPLPSSPVIAPPIPLNLLAPTPVALPTPLASAANPPAAPKPEPESPGIHRAGQNLRGQSFAGQNLRQADFTRADLTEARLASCDLRRAKLDGAILRRAKKWVIALIYYLGYFVWFSCVLISSMFFYLLFYALIFLTPIVLSIGIIAILILMTKMYYIPFYSYLLSHSNILVPFFALLEILLVAWYADFFAESIIYKNTDHFINERFVIIYRLYTKLPIIKKFKQIVENRVT